MRQTARKIFERTKNINNRLYALKQQQANQFIQTSTHNLIDNLSMIKKQFDGKMIYFGQGVEQFVTNLPNNITPSVIYLCDIHYSLLQNSINSLRNNKNIQIKMFDQEIEDNQHNQLKIIPICCEEELHPFPDESIQIIVSNMHLHWVNEVQVVLQRWLESLESDGLMIGSMFGADTLQELRIAFTLAENERYGGVSQHVSPFITISEIGNLISRLNYTMPTIVTDRQQYEFDSSLHLMQFLQDIGESEALTQKREGTYIDTINAVNCIYETIFRNEQSRVYGTFEQLYFSGWKYHPNQQKAKERGSSDISLQQIKKEIEQMEESGEIMIGQIEEESSSDEQ